MEQTETQLIQDIATTVRLLSMDAIQAANSGHPGLPLGCAELGALLYGKILKHNPNDPNWIDRDRFVLSAGHGSMLLYSLLYLSGYDLSLDDLKNFRRLGSKAPGHPEYGITPGVETTTGPLGAGFSNAVGMAIAEKKLSAKFNTNKHPIIDHYTYVLAGDGCMMEGVTSEAASLAGHLGLEKLIVFYDSNSITIEGSTDLAFSEDTATRFKSYGWQTLKGNAHNIEEISSLVKEAKNETKKPSLIVLKSIIGKGAPNKEGSAATHGAPLGEDEVKAAKQNLGVPGNSSFYILPTVSPFFEKEKNRLQNEYNTWQQQFKNWTEESPQLKQEWDTFFNSAYNFSHKYIPRNQINSNIKQSKSYHIQLPQFNSRDTMATRNASGEVLQFIAKALPNFFGGSADLGPSNNTLIPGWEDFTKDNPSGNTLRFGVREHAMGGITSGIILHEGFRAFCATFLVFSDYMRPALRLAAIMKLPVIYIFTHDSIFVGEDGPTHQPIEQLAALRSIPNLQVLRPGDAQETMEAWLMALENTTGPTALILTRQKLQGFHKETPNWKELCRSHGAHIVKKGEPTENNNITVIVATGSEVTLALECAKNQPNVQVVSMINRERFLNLSIHEQEKIIPPDSKVITAEAGIAMGWEHLASDRQSIFSIDCFGDSGPGDSVAKKMGFTAENLQKIIKENT